METQETSKLKRYKILFWIFLSVFITAFLVVFFCPFTPKTELAGYLVVFILSLLLIFTVFFGIKGFNDGNNQENS